MCSDQKLCIYFIFFRFVWPIRLYTGLNAFFYLTTYAAVASSQTQFRYNNNS